MSSLHDVLCDFCSGTGLVYVPKKRKCSVCHGTGKIPHYITVQTSGQNKRK